jgi:lipoate-protein ligase A
VVVGRFQRVEKEVDVAGCLENKIPILRRFTGGGAVYLDEGVACLSFCLPLQKDPLDVFRALSLSVGETVGAEIDKNNNLFIEKKKISGGASCKRWGSLFHHMTLLVDCNLENMKVLTPHVNQGKTASTSYEVANLGGNVKSVLSDIAQNFKEQFGVALTPGKLTEEERDLTDRLMTAKYRKKEWNFQGIDPFSW